MCRIENNYIPPGPEQYEKLAEYINSSIMLEYQDEKNISKTIQGVLRNIEINNYAEYLKLDNLSVRIDKVISVSKS